MRWLNNIKVGTKLIIGFIVVALLAGIVGGIGITKIKKIDQNYTNLYTNYGASIADVANVSISFQRLKINLNNITMYRDGRDMSDYANRIKNYDAKIQESLKKFEGSLQSDEAKAEFSNLNTLLGKYDEIKDTIIELSLSGKKDEALALMGQDSTQKLSDQINNSVDNLFQLKESGGFSRSNEYSAEVNNAVVTMIFVIVAAIIIALSLGIMISKAISNSISKLMTVTSEISKGNLDVEIINNSKDEIGILSEEMKRMKYRLNEVIGQIGFAAEQVTVGSRQIADSTIALSQGATEQASAVEELTASIEEISSQISVNAENAKKANIITDSTKTNAGKRNNEMKLMLKAMDEINVSSNNISRIIKVIDEIAFQTNILALNAAVEAARAGQYGKGFTVVAEEVRNLAARSAKAAKETTEIIEESIIKIQDGTNIANQTADALESIVSDIEEVAKIINGISDASEEQATGISQISQGIIQISQVVQSNSATSEESAAASEELAGQAEVLKEQVQMFRLASDRSSMSNLNNDYINHSIHGNLNKDTRNLMEENDRYSEKKTSSTKKIILSDNEFGKY
ncbi:MULTISPECIES: methyl-accepting chemotaxis protein [Clostridium]|uniref:Methyl-accepting chemotaxis protein n=1 Tax=Clostridium beijerinckii TaxID=1520 RepID=A0A1S9NB63_CLOBE|nr:MULTISPECIES: methyl-accepting chemotaxis protein [Clostridium]MBN7574528.1 MCP four helix bundle domain-containing protein [Clostridium beijerinckii]MBN7579877.1 MCP four helix bundle domain-containing protein [Clostridium beijerinckii]MBN7584378.1 MCP four helix bundle domain-containing protein [Clostridium beijerinckii]MBO0520177.1 MCP four helix bundle domain-containing protein [Clostridium beijerinckii]MZK49589.1 HAMP domain-containing protein [Clostridium beijerinckii]